MEKLLLDTIQREMDGQIGLVHPNAADKMVREKAPAQKLAQFRT